MNTPLCIGTRDSKLALWQAVTVEKILQARGFETQLVPVKSHADIDLTTPLHEFGNVGIFTKMLDKALYRQQIDIAVHSLKDYPTQLPESIELPAVLKRGPSEDILVYKDSTNFLDDYSSSATIATGSIRRIAQWKSRYPQHKLVNLRGNVQTRLQKLEDNSWQGAIFAMAGLERIELLPDKYMILDWMIPAPAQGVIAITCRKEDHKLIDILEGINHKKTYSEITTERQFLNLVEGGCSAPVGAKAEIVDQNINLKAGVFDLEGRSKSIIETTYSLDELHLAGKKAAEHVLQNGGKEIMKKIKHA